MSIKIEITSQEVRVRSGTSKKSGNQYSLREQEAYLHKPGQQYPHPIKITLDDNQPAYPVGVYELTPESFYPDRFGALAVRPRLVPVKAPLGKVG